jgi:HEAT repeat protein
MLSTRVAVLIGSLTVASAVPALPATAQSSQGTGHQQTPATAPTTGNTLPASPAKLAAALIADGKTEDGLKLLDQILAQKPHDREAQTIKIDALIGLGRTADAVGVYDTAVGSGGKHDPELARHLALAELRHLANVESPERDTAAKLLEKAGEPVPPMPKSRPPAAGQSNAPGAPTKPPTAEEILSGETATVEQRIGAFYRLQGPATGQTRQFIRTALTSASPTLKMAAIDTATRLDLRDLAPDIRPSLQDGFFPVKLKAAAAVRQFGDHAADELLQTTLKGEFFAGRLIAARALKASGDNASWIPAITPLLESPRPTERVLAAELLVDTDKSAEAVAILRTNLTADDPPVRADAARVLSNLTQANPWDFLPLLKDPNPAVRVHAAGIVVRSLPSSAATAKPAAPSRPASRHQ